MPTGYTASIKDGISFKEFAEDCSRAFGALVHLRDQPNAEIPDEIEPSTYHKEQIEDTRSKLKKVNMMSDEEILEQEKESIKKEIESYLETIEEKRELKKKYQDMLDKVKAWQPPSEDHVNFKKFMIDQIESSIDHDCDLDYYKRQIRELENKKDRSAYELRQTKIEVYQDSLEYHKRHWEEDKQRAKDKTQWIRQLKESLDNYDK